MHTELQYKYNGFEYRTYLEREDDNQKLFHYCYRRRPEDDQLIEVRMSPAFYNSSPYSLITVEEFKQFVDTQVLLDFVNDQVKAG